MHDTKDDWHYLPYKCTLCFMCELFCKQKVYIIGRHNRDNERL